MLIDFKWSLRRGDERGVVARLVGAALLLLLGASLSAQALPLLQTGQTFEAELATAGESRVFLIEAVEAATLIVNVKGKNGLLPQVEVAGPQAELVLAQASGKKGVKLSLVLPYTGTYLVRVSGAPGGETGTFKGKARVKLPKGATKISLPGTASPGEGVVFDAPAGSLLSGKLSLLTDEGPQSFFVVTGPSGPLEIADAITFKGTGVALLKKLPLLETGTYRVDPVTPDLGFKAKLKLKKPAKLKGAIEAAPAPSGAALQAPSLNAFPAFTTETEVALSGSAPGAASVEVIGPFGSDTVEVQDDAFELEVPLHADKINTLYLRALAFPFVGKHSAPRSVQITMDVQPPKVSVLFPSQGAEVTSPSVVVSGSVSDILSGAAGLSVRVNGQPAQVFAGIGTNGTFERAGVALAVGKNVLLVEAEDALGNTAQTSVTLQRVEAPAGAAIVEPLSGDDQAGEVHAELAQPLAVRVLRGDGSPFAGKLVTFHVTRSDGRLAATPGADPAAGALSLQVAADDQGQARAWWTLGGNAGSGNNRVEVTSADVFGKLSFCASAAPGAPAVIVPVNRMIRVGRVATELSMPVQARVLDGANPVAGVPVTFSVPFLDGAVNGDLETTVVTSSTGIAECIWTLGELPGPQRILATFPDNPGHEASWLASALAPTLGQDTTFTGMVFEDTGLPIGGATCRLVVNGSSLPSALSDALGRFAFDDVPEGVAELFVDATQATTLNGDALLPGSFPALHFNDLIVVPGVKNGLPAPVKLPRLDPVNARSYSLVDATVLELDGIEGLRVIIEPGSMTLPDGSPAPEGTVVSLNQVRFDRIPMPPPDGSSYPFAWTMQPGGSLFDPPARIVIPNMAGQAPGSIVYFSSFNHDTGRFDIIGTGAVSDDGGLARTDPGSGISIAGWAFPVPPPPPLPAKVKNCPGLDMWGYVKSGLKLVTDLTLSFTKIKEALECGYSLASLADDVVTAFSNAKLDGDFTAAEAKDVLSAAKSIKVAVIKCLGVLSIPDPGALAAKALKISNALAAALAAAQSSECVTQGATGKVLAVITLFNNGINTLLNVGSKLSTKQVATLAVCTILDQILVVLGVASSGDSSFSADDDTIAELEGLFAQLDEQLQASWAEDDSIAALIGDTGDWAEAHGELAVLDATPFDYQAIAGCSVQVGTAGGLVDSNGGIEIIGVDTSYVGLRAAEFFCEGPLYGRSEFFFAHPGATYVLKEAIVLGPTPPPVPVDLDVSPHGVLVIEVGQTVDISIVGLHSDGSIESLDFFEDGTWMGSTNATVASVDPDGPSVTGVSPGTAYVTITNQGLATTRRIDVFDMLASTTVAGFVHDLDGQPLPNAAVTTGLGGGSTTQPDGSFSFELAVPSTTSSFQVSAVADVGGAQLLGSKLVGSVVHGGTTDAGILVLKPPLPCEQGWLTTFGPKPGLSGFGSGGLVLAQTVFDDGGGPKLYVAGDFLEIGGLPANRIACWDGQRWSALGTGLDAPVRCLLGVADPALGGPALFAGGDFDQVVGTSILPFHLARWDGAEWSAVGPGFAGALSLEGPTVNALALHDDGSGPALFIGGDFTTVGGLGVRSLARWDGSQITKVGSGLFNGPVRALAVHDDGGGSDLFIGGSFTTQPVFGSTHVVRWTGSAFAGVGGGMNAGGWVRALHVHDDGSGPALFAAGDFTTAGSVSASRIAKWNGANWSALGGGLGGGGFTTVSARTLASFDDGLGVALFVGGTFGTAGGLAAESVARWKGNAWSSTQSGLSTASLVSSLVAYDPPGDEQPWLHAGGSWFEVAGFASKGTARFRASGWKPVGGGPDDGVLALLAHDDGGGAGQALYAGGYFLAIDGVELNGLGRWDGTDWTPVGGPFEEYAQIEALVAHDDGSGAGSQLFAGGYITTIAGVAVANVARWDGSAWSALGSGVADGTVGSWVEALAEFDDGLGGGPALYVGGNFETAGGLPARNIARWDGSGWSNLGSGVNALVTALVVYDDGGGPALFAAGAFNDAGHLFANRVAKWDGSNWTTLGSGLDNTVHALAVYDDGSGAGPLLYAGGAFTMAGGAPASRVARWDGSTWTALPGTLDDRVLTLDVFDDGGGTGASLYVGGLFTTGIARWDGTEWHPLGNGLISDVFGNDQVWAVRGTTTLPGGPALFAGGSLRSVPDSGDSNLARWACGPVQALVAANDPGSTSLTAHAAPAIVVPPRTPDLRVRRGDVLRLEHAGTLDLERLVVEAGGVVELAHPDARLRVRAAELQARATLSWQAGSLEIVGGSWEQFVPLELGTQGPSALVLVEGARVIAPTVHVGRQGVLFGQGDVVGDVISRGVLVPRWEQPSTTSAWLSPFESTSPGTPGLSVSGDYSQTREGCLLLEWPDQHVSDEAALRVTGTAHVDGRVVLSGSRDVADGDLASGAIVVLEATIASATGTTAEVWCAPPCAPRLEVDPAGTLGAARLVLRSEPFLDGADGGSCWKSDDPMECLRVFGSR